MKKRSLALFLSLILVVGLLAGCGSSATPSATTAPAASGGSATTAPANNESTEPSSYVQGVTDTEVIIANTAATSGAYAVVGVPFNAGIQAYLDMVNDAGGIDGRTITFKHVDDEFDAVKGKAYLQEMVEDEEVFAMVGHFGTPVVSATIDDLKEYGIPAVYFATGIGDLYAANATSNEEGYNLFPVQPIYTTEGQIMLTRAVGTFGAGKVGVIYTSDDAGKNMLEGAKAKAEELGVELVVEEVAAGASDVSAAVTSIKDAGVDFVIVAAIQATMPTIVKEMAAQNMDTDCITTYVCCSSAISEQVAADTYGKFDVYANGWVDLLSDAHQDALAQYKTWIDEEYWDNTYAMTGWIAASFFCEGLYRLEGQEVTWASYMAALESAPISNPFGGTIDYANGLRAGTQEMNLSKVIPISDENSSGWELVYDLASMDDILAGK